MAEVVLPHTFVDGPGNVASGEQVMENLQAIVDQVNGGLDDDNFEGALLKLAVDAGRTIKWGTVSTAAFDSTAGRSKTSGTIPHGMGSTPVWADVSGSGIAVQEAGGVHAVSADVTALDATNISYVATAPGTTNNATTLRWIAIG